MMHPEFTGLVAAPHTPFDAEGALALDVVEQQHARLVDYGVVGAFVCGTTGESLSLTTAERVALTRRWCEVAGDGFTIIAHVGGPCLADCRHLAREAVAAGADAISAMAPNFLRPASAAELAGFLGRIGQAAPETPLYYYHIPSMTGVELPLVSLFAASAGVADTLAGAKYTHEDLLDFQRCVGFDGGRMQMLFGRDEFLLAGLCLGAGGAVGATYNFLAPLYLEVMEHVWAGRFGPARDTQRSAAEIIDVLKRWGVLRAGKWIMSLLGIDCGPVRPPLVPLTDEQTRHLRHALEAAGFFDYAMTG